MTDAEKIAALTAELAAEKAKNTPILREPDDELGDFGGECGCGRINGDDKNEAHTLAECRGLQLERMTKAWAIQQRRASAAEATLAALTTEAQALPSVESIQGCVCGCSSVPPESVQHRDLIFARRAQLERAGMRKVVLDGHGCPPEHRDAEGRFVDGVYVVCAKCFDSIAAEPASLLGEKP